MGIFQKLLSSVGVSRRSEWDEHVRSVDVQGPEMKALSALPPVEQPKVRAKQAVMPSYLKTAKPNPDNRLTIDERRTANVDITSFRTANTTKETIRQFLKVSPDLSAAVVSNIRLGITSGYVAVAKNLDGTFNPDATAVLAQIITRMDVLNDYTLGFDDSFSLRSLSEVWAKEMMSYGAMNGELVLNKALLPDKIQPITDQQIEMYPSSDGKRMIPHQKLAGEDIPLDIPTFFRVTLDQDLMTAYSDSPIESALQAFLFATQFMNDIRRIVRKAIHPRVDVSIDSEKFMKEIPQAIANDPDKIIEYKNRIISDLEQRINGLEPEEALVHFDTIGIEVIDHGNTNLSNEYQVIEGMANAKMATGTKTLPTVLGHSNGTSNVASAEVMIFMKYVEGAICAKLNEMFSKMFTLAVRLLGMDVVVHFAYNPIDLRPESELESFRAQRQSRVLELLSYGFYTDDEASIVLTGKLPPPGFKPLSGTGFFNQKLTPTGDGYNGASNSGSTMNQNLKSDAPSGGARGSNKKAEIINLV